MGGNVFEIWWSLWKGERPCGERMFRRAIGVRV